MADDDDLRFGDVDPRGGSASGNVLDWAIENAIKLFVLLIILYVFGQAALQIFGIL